MTFAAGRFEEVTLRTTALTTRFDQAGALIAPGLFPRASVVVGDLLGVLAIVFSVPFVILAIGIPIALFGRLLLWIGGLL